MEFFNSNFNYFSAVSPQPRAWRHSLFVWMRCVQKNSYDEYWSIRKATEEKEYFRLLSVQLSVRPREKCGANNKNRDRERAARAIHSSSRRAENIENGDIPLFSRNKSPLEIAIYSIVFFIFQLFPFASFHCAFPSARANRSSLSNKTTISNLIDGEYAQTQYAMWMWIERSRERAIWTRERSLQLPMFVALERTVTITIALTTNKMKHPKFASSPLTRIFDLISLLSIVISFSAAERLLPLRSAPTVLIYGIISPKGTPIWHLMGRTFGRKSSFGVEHAWEIMCLRRGDRIYFTFSFVSRRSRGRRGTQGTKGKQVNSSHTIVASTPVERKWQRPSSERPPEREENRRTAFSS